MQTDEPLGLSVHNLPRPGEVVESATAGSRWKLLAIALVCSLPVLAAYLAYFVVRPQGHASIGELISPVRPVEALEGRSLQGQPVALQTLKGQWLLISVGDGACAAECAKRLYLQRQLRETLGKDKDRVDRVWLVSDDAPVSQTVLAAMNDASVLRVGNEVIQAWLPVEDGHAVEDYLFVVDPMGNTMMRLPSVFDGPQSAKARHDLDRLLKASASWDGPGR
jgi:hypothetical protein